LNFGNGTATPTILGGAYRIAVIGHSTAPTGAHVAETIFISTTAALGTANIPQAITGTYGIIRSTTNNPNVFNSVSIGGHLHTVGTAIVAGVGEVNVAMPVTGTGAAWLLNAGQLVQLGNNVSALAANWTGGNLFLVENLFAWNSFATPFANALRALGDRLTNQPFTNWDNTSRAAWAAQPAATTAGWRGVITASRLTSGVTWDTAFNDNLGNLNEINNVWIGPVRMYDPSHGYIFVETDMTLFDSLTLGTQFTLPGNSGITPVIELRSRDGRNFMDITNRRDLNAREIARINSHTWDGTNGDDNRDRLANPIYAIVWTEPSLGAGNNRIVSMAFIVDRR
jgi:hypothetical protein